jgi:hypothetical protein
LAPEAGATRQRPPGAIEQGTMNQSAIVQAKESFFSPKSVQKDASGDPDFSQKYTKVCC